MLKTLSRPEAHRLQVIDEIARAAVLLPPDTCFYNDKRYIAVAFDAAPDGIDHEVIGAPYASLPFLGRYEVISRLCDDRAMRTVDGALRAHGKVITPERYLGLWREAFAHPLTASEFAESHGYVICATLCGQFAGLRGKRKSWHSSPFETFDDFETAYSDKIEYLDEGLTFRIVFDLRDQDTARDAYYLECFLSSIDRSSLPEEGVALKRVAPPAQPAAMIMVSQPELFSAVVEAT